MKKFLKITIVIVSILVFVVVCVLSYIKLALPNVGPAPELKVEITPERVERGKYLAYNVASCMDCHSTRDWSKLTGPLVSGTLGKGGEKFDQNFGFPGAFYSPNLTPASLGNWTDGELFRAITTGVSKDGHALFPVMPYQAYGKMDEEDIKSIIAYLRTLPAIENTIPASKPDFPMNFIINTIPTAANFTKIPAKSDTLNYGKYLLNAAACSDCHSKQDKGKVIAGMEFAGGFEFPLPGQGVVRSANITPDKETGIGNWSKETFIRRFKIYADSNYVSPNVQPGSFNTLMPWTMFAGMTEEDLGAIYEALMHLQPKSNKVEIFTPNK